MTMMIATRFVLIAAFCVCTNAIGHKSFSNSSNAKPEAPLIGCKEALRMVRENGSPNPTGPLVYAPCRYDFDEEDLDDYDIEMDGACFHMTYKKEKLEKSKKAKKTTTSTEWRRSSSYVNQSRF
uniref:Secreted protein n=1 Tax=Panagrellus redivivus TaxID=6233 RepID=A0A7E4V945_PANRE